MTSAVMAVSRAAAVTAVVTKNASRVKNVRRVPIAKNAHPVKNVPHVRSARLVKSVHRANRVKKLLHN